MALTSLIRQLATFLPLLQLSTTTSRKYRKYINWLLQLAAFLLFLSQIKIGNQGLRSMIRHGEEPDDTSTLSDGDEYSALPHYIYYRRECISLDLHICLSGSSCNEAAPR